MRIKEGFAESTVSFQQFHCGLPVLNQPTSIHWIACLLLLINFNPHGNTTVHRQSILKEQTKAQEPNKVMGNAEPSFLLKQQT